MFGHLRGTAIKRRGIGTHREKLCGRGKMNGRKAWGLKRTKLQRLRMQSRLEQPSLADEQVGQTRSPRLSVPKQHHQHTQAAAAAAAAVIVAKGRGSNC